MGGQERVERKGVNKHKAEKRGKKISLSDDRRDRRVGGRIVGNVHLSK